MRWREHRTSQPCRAWYAGVQLVQVEDGTIADCLEGFSGLVAMRVMVGHSYLVGD